MKTKKKIEKLNKEELKKVDGGFGPEISLADYSALEEMSLEFRSWDEPDIEMGYITPFPLGDRDIF